MLPHSGLRTAASVCQAFLCIVLCSQPTQHLQCTSQGRQTCRLCACMVPCSSVAVAYNLRMHGTLLYRSVMALAHISRVMVPCIVLPWYLDKHINQTPRTRCSQNVDMHCFSLASACAEEHQPAVPQPPFDPPPLCICECPELFNPLVESQAVHANRYQPLVLRAYHFSLAALPHLSA